MEWEGEESLLPFVESSSNQLRVSIYMLAWIRYARWWEGWGEGREGEGGEGREGEGGEGRGGVCMGRG